MDPSTECRNTGPGGGGENQEIPPTEDLMREHGLLNRLLLVYDEGIRRIRSGEEIPPETLHHAARIIRDFVEDYHEHLEEQWVFLRVVPHARAFLADACARFVHMYRPHESREDTVLFPKLRGIISAHEFAALGEVFEREEQRRFGADGFQRAVAAVAGIEKRLGIYNLAQFTP